MVQRKDLDEWFGTLSALQRQITAMFLSSDPLNPLKKMFAFTALMLTVGWCHGQRPFRFVEAKNPHSLEISGNAFFSTGLYDRENITNPGLEVTFLNRSIHPLQKGFRLGLGIMDGQTTAVNATSDKTERRRALMPQAAGLLHLELFRGRFRPFVEGEAGVASTLLDVRTFDELEERTSYSIPSFDATLFYGWATGIRISMMEGQGFLVLRCGNRFGGQLTQHAMGDEPEENALLDGRRSSASIGISLTL